MLSYRDLKVGTLDQSPGSGADPVAVEQLFGSYIMAPSTIFSEDGRADAAKRARTIRAKATDNLEERDPRTLFLAWGLAA